MNTFNFVVKKLGFLKKLPLMAHIFDAQLRLWTFITQPHLADYLDDIETAVSGWRGVIVTTHRYGGLQFNYAGKEIGHIHSNGLLDVLFTRKIKSQLLNEGLVNHHHVFNRSGWISFYIKNRGDSDYALELLRKSYLLLSVEPVRSEQE